jgi:hypothetical protein
MRAHEARVNARPARQVGALLRTDRARAHEARVDVRPARQVGALLRADRARADGRAPRPRQGR